MIEINFRDFIEIIIKRKWIIITFTLAFILISAVVNFFVLKPVYEAKATLIIAPVDIKSGINPNTTVIFTGDPKSVSSARELENKMLGSILSMVKYPQFSIDSIVRYMNNTLYIDKVMKDININTEIYDYSKNINTGFDPKTNMVSISIKGENPDMAVKLEKAMVDYLPAFMLEKSNQKLDEVSVILTEGIGREKKNLNEWANKLMDFTALTGGMDKSDKLPVDKQGDYREIINNYTLANQALEAYQLINKELDNIKSINTIKMMDMQIVSESRAPLVPVSPKKKFNMVVAMILGLMVGVFAAIFMEYWEKSKIHA